MEPVLIGWGKKPKGADKHPPLVFLDPKTREAVEHGTTLSKGDFEGTDYVAGLIRRNNFLVETASSWGVGLGSGYGKFLEVGLRVAQQLDGRLRDLTSDAFEALYKDLEAELVKGVLAVRMQRRASGLESLLADTHGMHPDDIARLSGYVAQLKEKPIQNREAKSNGLPADGIEKRMAGIQADQTRDDEFVQNAKLVRPELRADYVRTVEVAELHGNLPYDLHGDVKDIRKLVDDLGVESGRLYLKVLNGLMTHFGERYTEAVAKIQAAKQQIKTAISAEARLTARKTFEVVQRETGVLEHPWQLYEDLNKCLIPLDAEGWNVYLIANCKDI